MRRPVVVMVLAAVFVLALLWGVSYISDQRAKLPVTITYTNAHAVAVYTPAGPSAIATVPSSGSIVKLKSGNYVIKYDGDSGYANGKQAFTVGDSPKTVSVTAYYSDAKLAAMLTQESAAILQALDQKYARIGLYDVQPGKLYHFGDWYGTTLVYKGNDYFNNDTLRVVLHEENGSWVVATDPPNITLSKIIYPAVPTDVLQAVNNQ